MPSMPSIKVERKYNIYRMIIALILAYAVLNMFLSGIVFSATDTIRPAISEIKADAYIVIDRNSGEVLLEHNSNKKINPASLTKILTAAIAIESLERDDVITTSQYAGSLPNGESVIDLMPGEQMKFIDMLYGMLLASGNDAAMAIAEEVSGDKEKFASLMNTKTTELGLTNSFWVNPSGVTDENHKTTASDLAYITKYALTLDLFREVVSTESYSLPVTNKHPYTGWNVAENTNKILRLQDSFYHSNLIDSVIGVKTGSTTAAGSNLITAAHVANGLDLICVINGVREKDSRNIWIYTLALLEEAARLSTNVDIIIDKNIPVTDVLTSKEMVPKCSFAIYNPNHLDFDISVSDADGFITALMGGEEIFRVELVDSYLEPTGGCSYSNSYSEVPVSANSVFNKIIFTFVAVIVLFSYTILVYYIARRRKRANNFPKIKRI